MNSLFHQTWINSVFLFGCLHGFCFTYSTRFISTFDFSHFCPDSLIHPSRHEGTSSWVGLSSPLGINQTQGHDPGVGGCVWDRHTPALLPGMDAAGFLRRTMPGVGPGAARDHHGLCLDSAEQPDLSDKEQGRMESSPGSPSPGYLARSQWQYRSEVTLESLPLY